MMFTHTLGKWTLIFEQDYRIVQDKSTAVVIDSERTALVLLSLTTNGNICIERTYYDMICEINAAEYKITFHNTENIAE